VEIARCWLSMGTALGGFLELDREPKAEGAQDGFEAAERGVPPLGEYAVQVLSVESRRLGERGAAPFARARNVSKGKHKDVRVVLGERGIQICARLFRVAEHVVQVLSVVFSSRRALAPCSRASSS